MSVLDVEKSRGQIFAFYGPMGSRKSGAIVDIFTGLRFNRCVKPIAFSSTVNVNDGPFIVARDGDQERKYPAIRVASSQELWDFIREKEFKEGHRFDIVGVDESNHFDLNLPYVLRRLADGGRLILAGGLDKTFRGDDFGPMGTIIKLADRKFPKSAYCQKIKENGEQCAKEAKYSARVRRVTPNNRIQPVSFFTFRGNKSEGEFGFDFYFSPTITSRDDTTSNTDYFATCCDCHKVAYAQETLTVQDYIFRHPGLTEEVLRREFQEMPHLDDIIRFLLDPAEHRTEIVEGRIRSYN